MNCLLACRILYRCSLVWNVFVANVAHLENVLVQTTLHFQRRIFQQGEPRTEFSSFSSNLCDVKIHCLQKYFCNATLTGMSAAFGAVEPKNITLLGVVLGEFLTWCDDVDILFKIFINCSALITKIRNLLTTIPLNLLIMH
jgi:hypothetical protein